MTTFLTMLGLVTLITWAYLAMSLLVYVLLFGKMRGGDQLFASLMWPVSLPIAVVLWTRYRLRRPRLPTARARARSRRCRARSRR